jgi:hypothetical protein
VLFENKLGLVVDKSMPLLMLPFVMGLEETFLVEVGTYKLDFRQHLKSFSREYQMKHANNAQHGTTPTKKRSKIFLITFPPKMEFHVKSKST